MMLKNNTYTLMNIYLNLKNKRGFTLIELLVVISIIGILSSVILASLSEARLKARNAKRLSDIKQYSLTVEMALDDNNEYPDPGTVSWYCLGDYSDNACWLNGTGFSENVTLNNILLNYFPSLPTTEGEVGLWEGYVYRCMARTGGICNPISIRWFMEGTNQLCAGGTIIDDDYLGLGITFCSVDKGF